MSEFLARLPPAIKPEAAERSPPRSPANYCRERAKDRSTRAFAEIPRNWRREMSCPAQLDADRTAKNISFEVWNIPMVKEVSRIKRAVPQELIGGAVKLICAACGDDIDL